MDWAIKLVLDHRAYVPAITLAKEAEKILGELLHGKSVFGQLKARLRPRHGLPGKMGAEPYMDRAINWLAHYMVVTDGQRSEAESEELAIQHIVGALTSLVIHDRSLPSEGPRFFAWLAKRQEASPVPPPPVEPT